MVGQRQRCRLFRGQVHDRTPHLSDNTDACHRCVPEKNASPGTYIPGCACHRQAQNNPDIRCIIITGGSGVFTAGNDLEDFLKTAPPTCAPRLNA